MHIRNDPSIKWPERIHTLLEKRSHDKYYRFHWDHRHDTNDYFNLKEQIEALGRQQIRHENARRDPQAREEKRPRSPR